MFAKTGFVLRSLFVASMLASVVACTFEGPGTDSEEEGSTSSAAKGKKGGGTNDKGDASAPSSSADGGTGTWEGDGGGAWCWNGCAWTQECPDDVDGGAWGTDASLPPYEPWSDASAPSHDAGYRGH